MANPFYSNPELEAYHKRNQTGLHGEAVGSVPRVGGSQDPQAVPQDLTKTGMAERAGLGTDVQAALVGSAASDVLAGKDPTRSIVTGGAQALGTAAGTAVGGPIGGAIGGALGGAAGNALVGPEVPQAQAQVSRGGGGGAPSYIPLNMGTTALSGPMAYTHGTTGAMSPDTFINGEIASQHYPDVQRLADGTEGMQGPAQGPMGTPDFGYIASSMKPTREEIHADIKAAGIENREMMKLKAEEQRKTEIHHLKMSDMAESAAIKQANLKKGPMAR